MLAGRAVSRLPACDPQVVARWRARWPQANWALSCGQSGLLALDLDVKTSPLPGKRFLPPGLGLDDLTADDGAALFVSVGNRRVSIGELDECRDIQLTVAVLDHRSPARWHRIRQTGPDPARLPTVRTWLAPLVSRAVLRQG